MPAYRVNSNVDPKRLPINRTTSGSKSKYIWKLASQFFLYFNPDNAWSTHEKRVRTLCYMMLALVILNLIPMMYILYSDPNDWIDARRRKRPVVRPVVTAKPTVKTTPPPAMKSKPSGEKLILFLDFPSFYMLDEMAGPAGLSACNSMSPFKQPIRCELTTDARRFNQSDGVVFYSHGLKFMDDFNFTPIKYAGQTWTFFAAESPPYSNNQAFSDPRLSGKFNSTMTYRTDSEFWHGYMRTERRERPLTPEQRSREEQELRWAFRNKTRMAAIFTSHCNTQSDRARYIRQMKRYMDIDVFGDCGYLKCDSHAKCDKMLADDYKFYLAFENSFCVDYITEKLLRPMSTKRVVSVVRGGADYSKLLPPHSVVDANTFFSSYELTHHLKALAEDEDEWVKMFEWTWHWRVVGPSLPLCPYCYHLIKRNRPKHLYPNILDWWTNGACYPPNDL